MNRRKFTLTFINTQLPPVEHIVTEALCKDGLLHLVDDSGISHVYPINNLLKWRILNIKPRRES